jgi:hypothetical protein
MSNLVCQCCGSQLEPFKNAKGEYLWLFEWQGSGGNTVYAKTREDALVKISEEFSSLKPLERSLRQCTWQQYVDFDRALQMMCV